MTQTSTHARFGLADCAKSVDSVLRALATIATKAELATLMAAITKELGFRHYALIHHDDLRGDQSNASNSSPILLRRRKESSANARGAATLS